MYTVWVDNLCIYTPVITDLDYKIISPVWTQELNKAGSFEFTLPQGNRGYDRIQKMKSLVTIKEDNVDVWWGRVIEDKRDYYNRKQIYCEGILAYLLDSIVRPYNHQGDLGTLFNNFISWHNSRVEADKRFTVDVCNVTDPNDYVHYSSTQYPKTLDEINEKLINTHGGYLIPKRVNGVNYISYCKNPWGANMVDSLCMQTIEFGKNLLDLTEHIDARDLITVLIPIGKDNLTIASVNNNKDYLESTQAVNIFGRIEGVQKWNDVTVASNLKTKGSAYLSDNNNLIMDLTIKAVDLHLVDVDVQKIKLGQLINVVSVPHNVDTLFPCSKIVTYLEEPDKTSFTLGVTIKGLTDRQIEIKKGLSK
jgi:phage minor structural protein